MSTVALTINGKHRLYVDFNAMTVTIHKRTETFKIKRMDGKWYYSDMQSRYWGLLKESSKPIENAYNTWLTDNILLMGDGDE